MTFFEKIKAHVGGLILIRTALYWYASGSWDKGVGRICLVVEVTDCGFPDAEDGCLRSGPAGSCALVQLLIDGNTCRVWLTDKYVDLIPGGDQ